MIKYAIVPVEPTAEMVCCGVIANQERMVGDVYAAMLASAPPSDQIAVPREFLERWVADLRAVADHMEALGRVSNKLERVQAEIRALLSPPATGEGK